MNISPASMLTNTQALTDIGNMGGIGTDAAKDAPKSAGPLGGGTVSISTDSSNSPMNAATQGQNTDLKDATASGQTPSPKNGMVNY